jgi:hypothetical protein
MLSQRQAASEWGVSRVTLQRYIRDGKLSLTPDKSIDPAEMLRAFGEPKNRHSTGTNIPSSTTQSTAETKALQAEIEHLKAMLTEKNARIDDLRQALRLGHDKPAPRRHWWSWGKA